MGDNWKCDPHILAFDLKTDTLERRYKIPRNLVKNESLLITPVSSFSTISWKFEYEFLVFAPKNLKIEFTSLLHVETRNELSLNLSSRKTAAGSN